MKRQSAGASAMNSALTPPLWTGSEVQVVSSYYCDIHYMIQYTVRIINKIKQIFNLKKKQKKNSDNIGEFMF